MSTEKCKMFAVTMTPSEAQAIRDFDDDQNLSRSIRYLLQIAELVSDYGDGSLTAGRNRLIFELENKTVVK